MHLIKDEVHQQKAIGALLFHERRIVKVWDLAHRLFTISVGAICERIRSRCLWEPISIRCQASVGGLSRTCTLGGRALILFTALLLIVMPWTEYFWHFDRFLRGGQDFEFGLLSLATLFALVLVLSQCRKRTTTFILAIRGWWPVVSEGAGQPTLGNLYGLVAAFYATFVSSFVLEKYSSPIRV
jgi:hypothetical protein